MPVPLLSGGESIDDLRVAELGGGPDLVTPLDRDVHGPVEPSTDQIASLGLVLGGDDEERPVLAARVVGTDGEEGESGKGGVVFHTPIIPDLGPPVKYPADASEIPPAVISGRGFETPLSISGRGVKA